MALLKEALSALDAAITQTVRRNDHEGELKLRDLRRDVREAAGLIRVAPPTEVLTDEEQRALEHELPQELLARCIRERVLQATAA